MVCLRNHVRFLILAPAVFAGLSALSGCTLTATFAATETVRKNDQPVDQGEAAPISPNPRAFFWGGWGGSIAVTDLDLRATITYVMNRMEANLMGDPRGGGVAGAAFASLMAS